MTFIAPAVTKNARSFDSDGHWYGPSSLTMTYPGERPRNRGIFHTYPRRESCGYELLVCAGKCGEPAMLERRINWTS